MNSFIFLKIYPLEQHNFPSSSYTLILTTNQVNTPSVRQMNDWAQTGHS